MVMILLPQEHSFKTKNRSYSYSNVSIQEIQKTFQKTNHDDEGSYLHHRKTPLTLCSSGRESRLQWYIILVRLVSMPDHPSIPIQFLPYLYTIRIPVPMTMSMSMPCPYDRIQLPYSNA